MPSLSRAIFLMNSRNFPSQLQARRFPTSQAAAKILGIDLQRIEASTPAELTAALAEIQASSAEALITQNDAFFGDEADRILAFAAARRLPIITESLTFGRPSRTFLMSYGPDGQDNVRRGASYVDRILKGAKPADLPVQLPTKFLLTVNLSTAKALGLTIPQAILARADEVIE